MRALGSIIVLFMVSPAFSQQPKEITNSIGMKLVLIHAGSFRMGSPVGELDQLFASLQHRAFQGEL